RHCLHLHHRGQREHMGALVPSNLLTGSGFLSDRDSYLLFHPSDSRVPHMLIARRDCPTHFLEVTPNPKKPVFYEGMDGCFFLGGGEEGGGWGEPTPAGSSGVAYTNSIFIARLKPTWSEYSKLPWGEAVRCLGEAGEIRTETDALLAQHQVNHGEFPRGVLHSLRQQQQQRKGWPRGATGRHHCSGGDEKEEESRHDPGANVRGSGWKIPEAEVARRRDLRGTRVFTIDPSTAKDLDDALHVTPLEDGTVEVGVHIADVSHFFQPGSELDKEAQRRGTTVYLVQQVGQLAIR
ncbi:unnamed protein product, partial [Discosporangium mesarthrocarpum]